MQIEPVDNRVIILPKEPDESDGGIIIPETAREAPTLGTAAFVGPMCRQVKQGDTVIFPKLYGTEFQHGGKTYLIIKEEQIHSIIR